MPAPRRVVECVSEGWTVAPLAAGRTRRGPPAASDAMVDRLLAGGRLELVHALSASADPRRSASPTLDLNLDAASGDALVLAVRHPSGALTFHLPDSTGRRGGARARSTHHFSVPISPESAASARRGILDHAVKVFALRVAGQIADLALPVLAGIWEQAAWKRRKLAEGWVGVSSQALSGPQPLPPADLTKLASPPQRNLLLLHGTFSNAKAAFAGLASTAGAAGQDFFAALQPLYGDRIFAFNHFTVSRSPEDNARMLLQALPAKPALFDCVTHSRGGLVLRHLVERRSALGALAERFQLGRAVLVASPNQGTPLASPLHFDKLLGWLSNLLELFPDNPFTFALDLVTEGLAWLAHRVAGSLPGLASMDADGPVIAALQAKPGPPADAYSALTANYEPDQSLLQRIADTGVDIFFQTANDLVVPTEGGWRTDPTSGGTIPGGRIGCFGRGGNQPAGAAAVTHTSFFSRPETVDFLVRALRGEPQTLSPFDPGGNLPYLLRRGVLPQTQAQAAVAQPARPMAPAPPPIMAIPSARPALSPEVPYDEIFNLAVLPSNKAEKTLDLMAAFRNARVIEKFDTTDREVRQRWRAIDAKEAAIKDYIDGTPGAKLPDDDDLREFGQSLFEVLFPGDVRRLYDVARALQSGRRLNIIFTSMIDWIAEKPWEFAYDPSRKNFLAVEDVNFIRNVLTAVPADRISPRPAPLRILVVVAQPLGTASLSVDEETKVIQSGFQRLIDSGLAVVDVLLDATPDALHRTLETAAKPVDVLHFIGHGVYDEKTCLGYLIFENEEGGVQQLDSQVLRQIVCRRDIRLVFLNACETGQGGRADFNRGVAPALVAGGVPAVVANQYSVLDSSATSFARHFYWALAQGRSIGDAARESRVAVNYSISGEAIDWAVPVVYARNPSDVLCTSTTLAARDELARVVDRRQRLAALPRECVVGIWDVNRLIPGLSGIVDSLTRAQGLFRFQLLSFSAPLGTWQREGNGEQVRLRADEVARRLQSKPDEFGVDRLIAITNLPLCDDKTPTLYAWHKDPNKRIYVFSTYGLEDQIAGPGLSIEHLIANAVAGFLTDLPMHRRGIRTCPLYDHQKREIRLIAGPLEFCGDCTRKVKNPKLREALVSILKSFR